MRLLPVLAATAAASAQLSGAVKQLALLGSHITREYDMDTAENVVYDHDSMSALAVNKDTLKVDVLSIVDPTNPHRTTTIDVDTHVSGFELQALAYVSGSARNIVAVAAVNSTEQDPGTVSFYDTSDYSFLSEVAAGAHPEHMAVHGTLLVVANEGVPDEDDLSNDPDGSITVIDVSEIVEGGLSTISPGNVNTYSLRDLPVTNADTLRALAKPVRIFGDSANDAPADLEPESVAISEDGLYAFLNLQDNNAIATFDLTTRQWVGIDGLGFIPMCMDASDKLDAIDIKCGWPSAGAPGAATVMGMPQPDGISAFTVGGVYYVATANEGDLRDYITSLVPSNGDVEGEEVRLKDIGTSGANAAAYMANEELGRLKITTEFPAVITAEGTIEGDVLYSPGTRSFSIFAIDVTDGSISMVYDSGDDFERLLERTQADYFNTDDTETAAYKRSDDKGCEPEPIECGRTTGDGSILCFIGLERQGGIVVYDVSDPANPVFQDYLNNRNFCDIQVEDQIDDGILTIPGQFDNGPEGLAFVPAAKSPAGYGDILVVSNAISGSVSVYSVTESGSDAVRAGDGSICAPPLNIDTGCGLPGDFDGSEALDVIDVVAMIQVIIGAAPAPTPPEGCDVMVGDMNQDGVLNVLDVITVIQVIISA